MTAGRIIWPVADPVLDAAGKPVVGATLGAFINGTTTPLATYSDSDLSVANPNPVVTNSAGRLATSLGAKTELWADTSLLFSLVLKDADGAAIATLDDVQPLASPTAGGDAALDDLSNVTDADFLAKAAAAAVLGQGFRNRVINGAMRINERNADAAVVLNNTGRLYGLDRWCGRRGASQAATIQRSPGGPNIAFGQVALFACTTGAAAGSGDEAYIETAIEGVHVVDANFGSSAAKNIAIRARVQPTNGGKYSFYLQNSDRSRSYVFTKTLVAAWQEIEAIIPGDQAGTWATDVNPGLIFGVDMGSGSAVEGAADGWAAVDRRRTSDSGKICSTTGQQFDNTGVQVAFVDDATVNPPFEERAYADELRLCRRYYRTEVISARITVAGSGAFVHNSSSFEPMRVAPNAAQAANNVAFTSANVSASTSTYATTLDSVSAYRVSSSSGDSSFSERVGLDADYA